MKGSSETQRRELSLDGDMVLHSNLVLGASRDSARRLAAGRRDDEGWISEIAQVTLNADEDNFGTFIATKAILGNPSAQSAPKADVDQIEDAVESFRSESRSKETRRGLFVLFTGFVSAVIAMIFLLIAGESVANVFTIQPFSSWIRFFSIPLCAAASSMFCAAETIRGKPASFALCALVAFVGCVVAIGTLGSPPITAIACWLAWRANSDDLKSFADDNAGSLTNFRNRLPRRNRNSMRPPAYVVESRRLASDYENSDTSWVKPVSLLVQSAQENDFGTYCAAYAVLASIDEGLEVQPGEDEIVVPIDQKAPLARIYRGAIIGATVGLIATLFSIASYAAHPPLFSIAYGSILVAAGSLAGLLSPQPQSDAGSSEDNRSTVSFVTAPIWKSFWTVYILCSLIFLIIG